MSRTRIKICGIKTPEVARAAVDAGADFIGMVFVRASPRFVTGQEARGVIEALGGRAEPVGVFTDASDTVIRAVAAAVPIPIVQLNRKTEYDPTSLAPLRVVRAVSFFPETIADELASVDGRFDALLIDTPDPTKLGGGTGQTFDWSALRAAIDRAETPAHIILAGGLTPENVAEAVRIVRPWAVDVSSGVESSRGVKDIAKIRAFCEAVKKADQ